MKVHESLKPYYMLISSKVCVFVTVLVTLTHFQSRIRVGKYDTVMYCFACKSAKYLPK